jgi:hypothetical protein
MTGSGKTCSVKTGAATCAAGTTGTGLAAWASGASGVKPARKCHIGSNSNSRNTSSCVIAGVASSFVFGFLFMGII